MLEMIPPSPVLTYFPYQSHYVSVLGSHLHYLDEGQGVPIIFLNDNPSWS